MKDTNNKNIELLKGYTLKVLKKCKINTEIGIGGNNVQFTLHIPSGDMKYEAFWIRDAAMMAESGLIPHEEIKGWLDLIALAGQNGPEAIELENGLAIPPWAIADHITFEGKSTYYPGSGGTGSNQGDGTYGTYPPHDDQYYFIEMAYLYYISSRDISFFSGKVSGMPIIERLARAFESYNIDEQTQLCVSSFPKHTVDWGFCDTIIKSGCLLFPSLLRYRAALRLKELYTVLKDDSKVAKYNDIAQRLKETIIKTFYTDSGWFLSATGICRQHDVWGTAFALWLNILEGSYRQKSAEALLKAFENGTAVNNGYVRHILAGEDASGNSAWEKATSDYNTYQNGGYWATPAGWYAYALSLVDMEAAFHMLDRFIQHTIKFEQEGAPFEWRSADDKEYSGRLYGASAALPYTGAMRMIGELPPLQRLKK